MKKKILFRFASGVAVFSLFVSMGFVKNAFADGPFVTLNNFSGTAQTIQVSGGGFSNGETVNIYLGNTSNPVTASAVAGSNSLFGPVAVTIPNNSPQGSLNIIAVGQTSNLSASNSFYVVPFNPSITVTGTTNTPGTSAIVSGSNFAPNEPVTLTLASATATVNADSSGSFAKGEITIPVTTSGVYILKATGSQSSTQAINYFYIGGFYPGVTPSSYYILPGSTLTFSGGGFAGNENVQVTENSTNVASFTTDSSGNFSNAGGVTVGSVDAGKLVTYNLKGNLSGATASTTVTIGQFFPSVFPSSYYVAPGSSISFSGGGFAAGESVKIEQGTKLLATFTTDSSGNYTNAGTISVPFNLAGQIAQFNLVGAQSSGVASVGVTVGQFYPQISPSSYYVLPGSTITVNGSGFAPNENISLTSGSASANALTDTFGNFAATSITIPYTSTSMATVTATGGTSHATAAATITLGSFFPTVTPSSYYVQPGSSVSFTGSGFAPSEKVQVVVGRGVVGLVTTDAQGNLTTGNFGVIPNASGSITYQFTGSVSGTTVSSTIAVAGLNPGLSADNYYALPGTVVNVVASGFAGGEVVHIAAGSFDTNATADNTGTTSSVPVTIPFGNSNTVNITATGSLSGATSTATISIAPFMPQVTPSTYFTSPGSSVDFTGSGFAPNEKIGVTLNNSSLTGVTTNTNGNFTVSENAPNSGSNANFKFTGGLSNSTVALDIGMSGFYPSVGLSNYYAQGGATEVISGSGFEPNESINLTFGTSVLGPTTADQTGAFSLATNVPFDTAGNKIVTVTGATSGATASTTFTQAPVYVSVQLATYAGKPGTAITFIGSGYLPNEPINITTDRTGSTVLGTFNADASGNFNNSSFIIPADFKEGNLSINIIGTHSMTRNVIVFYVNAP